MFKNLLVMLFVITGLRASAQSDNSVPNYLKDAPFDFRNLEESAKVSIWNDTIKPLFINGKFYYKNTLSKKTITTGFDEAYPFCKGYAVVKINGRYGIIDKVGKVIIKPGYERFAVTDDFPTILLGDQEFNYNTGELTKAIFHEVVPYIPQNSIFRIDGKYGVKFEDGHKTEAIYDTVLSAGYKNFAVVRSGKIGVVDRAGKIIIPLIYDDFKGGYPDGIALRSSGKWNYFKDCKLIFRSKNQPVYWRYDKIIFKAGDYYGSMDSDGTQILSAKYKWISTTAPVALNKKNELVFYSKGSRDFVYYIFHN